MAARKKDDDTQSYPVFFIFFLVSLSSSVIFFFFHLLVYYAGLQDACKQQGQSKCTPVEKLPTKNFFLGTLCEGVLRFVLF